MQTYSILAREDLDSHATTLPVYRKWLSQAFDAVRRWLESELDETDEQFCAAVVNRASKLARRLGAGHIAAPHVEKASHEHAMDLLGRLLAWVDQQKPVKQAAAELNIEASEPNKELTIKEAAQLLSVHTKTVGRYIAQGALVARDAAPPSSQNHDWRIPLSAVLTMRSGYQSHAVKTPIKQTTPHTKKFTPKLLAWG
jgi:hypothetical protein